MQGKVHKKTTTEKLDLSYPLRLRYDFFREILSLNQGLKRFPKHPGTPGE